MLVTALVMSFLLLSNGVLTAGAQACRPAAPEGTQTDQESKEGCCCTTGGENNTGCCGLKAPCGQPGSDITPVSMSNTQEPAFDVISVSTDTHLSTLDVGHVHPIVPGKTIAQPVHLNLLC